MLEFVPECWSASEPPSLPAAAGGTMPLSSDHDRLPSGADWSAAGTETELERHKKEKGEEVDSTDKLELSEVDTCWW